MKIHCFSKDKTPAGEIVIDIVGIAEESIDPDDMGYILNDARVFADNYFIGKTNVMTERELRILNQKEALNELSEGSITIKAQTMKEMSAMSKKIARECRESDAEYDEAVNAMFVKKRKK